MAQLQAALQKRRKMEEGAIWASEIAPRLYLGRGQDAKNLHQLQHHGITHILNVADDVGNFHPNYFSYANLNVTDFGGDKGIGRVFPLARDFVKSALEVDRCKVLVHCANGSNRSATVVIALLMMLPLTYTEGRLLSETETGMSLKEAYDHVKIRHAATAPLRDNRAQLILFEKDLRGSCSMSEEDFK
ncbi:dual specificity protein phosphatase 9-like [Amphiura filiformis]|uniref:dual specificity protein phosphatase 9-like n=1 Tax=Amphiura filiformis TaxID=82378 RepID=UPI003B20DF78